MTPRVLPCSQSARLSPCESPPGSETRLSSRLTDKAQQEESEVFQKAGNTHRLGEAGAEGGRQAAGESLAGKMLRPLGALGLHPIPALQRRGAPGPRKVRC